MESCIDTHVHLNFEKFAGDIEECAQRWRSVGVVALVHSCVEPSEFPEIQSLADRFPEIRFAVGLHPLEANRWTEAMGSQIRELAASDERVVAIGELGLDFYYRDTPEEIEFQKLALNTQLDIAWALDKPVIIHCRSAAEALQEILQNRKAEGKTVSGVMHCWGGPPEQMQWFLDLGLYISFSGIVTFKNAQEVQQSALVCPLDRLLIETDCPFLAPVPKRGKRNEPAFVNYVAQAIAKLRSEPLETILEVTTNNARTLFRKL